MALWAGRAARALGGHYLVGAIAIAVHEIYGNTATAALSAVSMKSRRKDATVANFFLAFPFADPELRSTLTFALEEHGF